MPDTKDPYLSPGYPAFNPGYTAESIPFTGALDAKLTVAQLALLTNWFIPLKTFQMAMPGGATQTFYYNMPDSVSPAAYALLNNNNGGTKATGTFTYAGTMAITNTTAFTINGLTKTFNAIAGDTTVTQMATDAAAFINANFPGFVVATHAVGVVTVTAVRAGAANDYAIASVYTGAGSCTASGANMTGGVNGAYFS